ncbi:MAG: AcrR family transcriptional regulator [Hyphomicrobiaceae bacterium]|jgi:AcrR family transcriptional regulator
MQPEEISSRGDKARQGLLAIASDCFSRHGFAGTSIDRVAKAAGVTKGAIYYHFRDKEDLLAASVADRVRAFEDSIQRAADEIPADEALRGIAEICARNTRRGDHTRFAIKLMVEAIDSMPKVSEQLRGMMRRFRAYLRNTIRRGQAEGLFRSDADAAVLAGTFTSGVIGAQIQFYQDEERFDLEGTLGFVVEQLIASVSISAAANGASPTQIENEETGE